MEVFRLPPLSERGETFAMLRQSDSDLDSFGSILSTPSCGAKTANSPRDVIEIHKMVICCLVITPILIKNRQKILEMVAKFGEV